MTSQAQTHQTVQNMYTRLENVERGQAQNNQTLQNINTWLETVEYNQRLMRINWERTHGTWYTPPHDVYPHEDMPPADDTSTGYGAGTGYGEGTGDDNDELRGFH